MALLMGRDSFAAKHAGALPSIYIGGGTIRQSRQLICGEQPDRSVAVRLTHERYHNLQSIRSRFADRAQQSVTVLDRIGF